MGAPSPQSPRVKSDLARFVNPREKLIWKFSSNQEKYPLSDTTEQAET